MVPVYIGLGSNLGDRSANLARARREIGRIPGTRIDAESSIEETEPVDFIDQPKFLNQVVRVVTDMKPEELLDALQNIETRMGRVRDIPKGPRVIDCDILLYGCETIATGRLDVPHPEIKSRDFVLRQMREIDPDCIHITHRKEVPHGPDKKHQRF